MDNRVLLLVGISILLVLALVLVLYRQPKPSKNSRPRKISKDDSSLRRVDVDVDEQKVASLIDTQPDVADMLEDLLDKEDEDDDDGGSSLSLDKRHSGLLDKILTRGRWSKDEFAELAKRHRLMADGAVERINSYAVEVCEEILIIDRGDYWEIDQDISSCLKSRRGQWQQ